MNLRTKLIFPPLLALLLGSLTIDSGSAAGSPPFPSLAAAEDELTPARLWRKVKADLPPIDIVRGRDEIVTSDSDPAVQLRRIEVKFSSQELEGRTWKHPCVIYLPPDPGLRKDPGRRGKVVIVGQRSWDGLATGPWRSAFLGNYGEPIAALTGYPVMICPVPGEYDEAPGFEISIGFLRELGRRSGNAWDHSYFRLAVPYLRALDVFAEILQIDPADIRAVIGGHSKRATSAFTAAAVDPKRIRGVVYMGNESTWGNLREGLHRPLCPAYTRRWVEADVLYLGATNEDGYTMFNINRIQDMMKGAWTVEMIPNYRHGSMSEKHFLDWRMWVSRVFDGRPLTRIRDLSFREVEGGFQWGMREYPGGTVFRARVDSPNKIIQVKVWYVYNDDEPFWRDLVWYPEFMVPREDGFYEGFVRGRLPDAWLVEVKDTAMGFPGYVTSLPQDITGKAAERRTSHGSRSRHWAPRAVKKK